MLSRGTELVNSRVEPLTSGAELLQRKTEQLKRYATRFLRICQKKIVNDWGNTIVNVIFGVMMVGLAALFTLLYTGLLDVG